MHKNDESRVILSKDTKHLLQPGVVLRFPTESYMVETVLRGSDRCRSASSVSVTVSCSGGGRIYCAPSSLFYGAEIVF